MLVTLKNCYTDSPRWSFLLWILQQYPGSPWQMLKDLLINNNYHMKWYLILEIKNKLKCNCTNAHKKWTKKEYLNPQSNYDYLYLNSLHPNISMHFLHTVLYTFPNALARRICLTIKNFFSCLSLPLFSWS